jgi:hypothetical protein
MAALDASQALFQKRPDDSRAKGSFSIVNVPVKVGVHVLENKRERSGGIVEHAVNQGHDVLVPELLQDARLSYDVIRDPRIRRSVVAVVALVDELLESERFASETVLDLVHHAVGPRTDDCRWLDPQVTIHFTVGC